MCCLCVLFCCLLCLLCLLCVLFAVCVVCCVCCLLCVLFVCDVCCVCLLFVCCLCKEYISNYRKLATKTVYLQHEQQHDSDEDKHDTKLHQQQVHEHLHAQVAQPVSTALRARSFVTPLDVCVTCTSWLKVFLRSHPIRIVIACAFLFDFTFPPFLLRPDLHRPLPLLLSHAPRPAH